MADAVGGIEAIDEASEASETSEIGDVSEIDEADTIAIAGRRWGIASASGSVVREGGDDARARSHRFGRWAVGRHVCGDPAARGPVVHRFRSRVSGGTFPFRPLSIGQSEDGPRR